MASEVSTSMGADPLVLVLPSGERLPVADTMTIGRDDAATLRLDDRTVSRSHARIVTGPDGPVIEDAGSRFGITISGRPLSEPQRLLPGQEIRLGNIVLRVESAVPPPTRAAEPIAGSVTPARATNVADPPNATIVVPIGATGTGLRAVPSTARDGSIRPRLRSGWALKRVESDREAARYVLRNLRDGSFQEIDGADAQLIELLDGERPVAELLVQATNRVGASGPARLARLLADLGDRGMLDGVAPAPPPEHRPSLFARAFRSRERTFNWVPEFFQKAYLRWGRLLFSPLMVTGLILLSLAGVAVFSYLVGARYGTPLVVAHRLLIGGAVFIAGRFAIVAVHETAHGLALAHYGRTTNRAGVRLLFIFPYAFVDSSEAYFEPRTHRIAISAAGPLSDFSLGALFAIVCAAAPPGNVRDVFFQLAFAGFVGAFFNVNPFLDRDGYQILSEWLREPKLKRRAREQLSQRITGRVSPEQSSPVLARYAIAGLVWTVIGAGFVAVLTLRYYSNLAAVAPHSLILGGFILFFAVLLIPIPLALGVPLFRRARHGAPEVNRVIK